MAASELEVRIRSATPNFAACEVELIGDPVRNVKDGQVRWKLTKGENTLVVRSRNLFGVEGPLVTATVEFQP